MSVVSAVFWGVIILSLLVFVHEGGHFLLARAFGVRVTEFFLGLPCRFKLSHRSRRYGTEVGVTPLLLGGYNRICGMEGDDDGTLAGVLACVQAHGRVSVDEVATECALDHDVALASLVTLSDWASVEAFYDPEKGERPTQRYYPECFQTVRRDGALLTAYDRDHDFEAPGVSDAGAPRPIEGEPEGFLSGERSHTYQGLGFWRRFCILVAGATVNVVCGFLLVVCVLMFAGVETTTGTNVISGVVEGSLAQDSGLAAGDSITVRRRERRPMTGRRSWAPSAMPWAPVRTSRSPIRMTARTSPPRSRWTVVTPLSSASMPSRGGPISGSLIPAPIPPAI
jgi:regulator of sigma E protease